MTRVAAEIAEALLPIARSMRPDELWAVAQADHRHDPERHLAALREVIGLRDGIISAGENFYPRWVVELAGFGPEHPGFEGCTAILLLNALKVRGKDGWSDFTWENLSPSYFRLRPSARDPILAAIRWFY